MKKRTWLDQAEKVLGFLSVPQLGLILVTLQGLGFLFVQMDPQWTERLALLPDRVMAGEYWRLITFLSLPLADGILWEFFALWFLYFIFQSLEAEWGAFKTTFYVLVSVAVTQAFSLATGYPVLSAQHFETSVFLAAAMLFPSFEVSLFFLFPVKLAWLGLLSGVLVVWEAIRGDAWHRLYLVAIYSNFLLFFGPALWEVVRREGSRRLRRR